MSYYTALTTEWPLLTIGTTAAKLAQLNAMTSTGTVPTQLYATGAQLLNCINWTEFAALTAAQQTNLLALCNNAGPLLGGSAESAFITSGMFLAYFANHSGPTVLALTALAQAAVQPWYIANGYPGPINLNDLKAAGNLT